MTLRFRYRSTREGHANPDCRGKVLGQVSWFWRNFVDNSDRGTVRLFTPEKPRISEMWTKCQNAVYWFVCLNNTCLHSKSRVYKNDNEEINGCISVTQSSQRQYASLPYKSLITGGLRYRANHFWGRQLYSLAIRRLWPSPRLNTNTSPWNRIHGIFLHLLGPQRIQYITEMN